MLVVFPCYDGFQFKCGRQKGLCKKFFGCKKNIFEAKMANIKQQLASLATGSGSHKDKTEKYFNTQYSASFVSTTNIEICAVEKL